MNTRALFALCLVGIMLVAFGCTGSKAATPPAQTPSAVKPATPTAPAPAPVTPPTETPTETAPVSPAAASNNFVNSKCTLSTESADMVLLFKDLSHYKTEVNQNGKLMTTMWNEGDVVYTLPAGQASGVMMKVPKTVAPTGAGASDASGVMPSGAKYSCVPTAVSDADVTHPAGTTFMDLSALGTG